MIKLNVNHILDLAAFVANDATRNLHGVYVDSDKGYYVASNGHILGAIEEPEAQHLPHSMIVKCDKTFVAAVRAIRRAHRSIDLDCLVLADNAAAGQSLLGQLGSSSWDDDKWEQPAPSLAVPVALIDGTFLDWSRVVPTQLAPQGAGPQSSFNGSYMAPFMLDQKHAALAILPTPADKYDPAGFSHSPVVVLNGNRPDFFGVLMPMSSATRADKSPLDRAPSWLQKRLSYAQEKAA
jgi:hypothetical protein